MFPLYALLAPFAEALQLKRRLEAPCGFPAEGMRLIYKGRVLADSSALHTYAVDNDCTLHLVRSAQSISSPPPPAPMAAAALPSDPMAGAMLASLTSNPELLRSLLRSHPQTAAMMDTNPELAQALSDPDTLRRALELQNPATRDEAMRVADRQLANVEGAFLPLLPALSAALTPGGCARHQRTQAGSTPWLTCTRRWSAAA